MDPTHATLGCADMTRVPLYRVISQCLEQQWQLNVTAMILLVNIACKMFDIHVNKTYFE
jgi:hypothetical protein